MEERITVSVDSDVAKAYRSASESDRRKLDLLINLRLREVIKPEKSLQEITSEISRNVQRRGLTPEILQAILDEKNRTGSPLDVPGVDTRANTTDIPDAVGAVRKKD